MSEIQAYPDFGHIIAVRILYCPDLRCFREPRLFNIKNLNIKRSRLPARFTRLGDFESEIRILEHLVFGHLLYKRRIGTPGQKNRQLNAIMKPSLLLLRGPLY